MDDGTSGGAKLFVYGVNRNCPKTVLEEAFMRCGAVTDVHITEKVRSIGIELIAPTEIECCCVITRLKFFLS